jgi:hypothetical protein
MAGWVAAFPAALRYGSTGAFPFLKVVVFDLFIAYVWQHIRIVFLNLVECSIVYFVQFSISLHKRGEVIFVQNPMYLF